MVNYIRTSLLILLMQFSVVKLWHKHPKDRQHFNCPNGQAQIM
jgi:hypothetical protein